MNTIAIPDEHLAAILISDSSTAMKSDGKAKKKPWMDEHATISSIHGKSNKGSAADQQKCGNAIDASRRRLTPQIFSI